MEKTAKYIEETIQQDPGGRGIQQWATQNELLPATQSLAQGKHIIITTGFYILSAGAIETDGPPGAIVLAHALMGMGKEVTLLIDAGDVHIMREGMKAIGCTAEVVETSKESGANTFAILKPNTTHFIALERPGQASDGCYYNFRGCDLSDYITPLDTLFETARASGITTIGIGDGGNELGLGNVATKVDNHISPPRPFSCQTTSDYCICAGVSNWGGYGMAALLSVMDGKAHMASPDGLAKILDAITEAGAVDGITGANTPSVDGLETSWEHLQFKRMYDLVT